MLTREHIWADWLKAYIPKDALHYNSSRKTVWRGGRVTDHGTRKIGGDVKSRRVQCVCSSSSYPPGTKGKGCNDGWMGKLQQRIKPTMIPLLSGQKLRITQRQQKDLAAWIAMAVMCSEFGQTDSVTISQEERTILYKQHAPPRKNWVVHIGDYERIEWVPEWGRHVLHINGKESGKTALKVAPPPNTQSTFFTVGRLYIHCISSVFPTAVTRFRFAPGERKFLRQIWPPSGAVVDWPPDEVTMADINADRMASRFFEWLRDIGERS